LVFVLSVGGIHLSPSKFVQLLSNLKEFIMYSVAIVRYGKVTETFAVKNLQLFDMKLEYIRKYTQDGVVYYVMAEKVSDVTSLSTGSVGIITKGLA